MNSTHRNASRAKHDYSFPLMDKTKQASSVDYRTPEQRAAVVAVWVMEFRRITP